jgi:hypothetical protein
LSLSVQTVSGIGSTYTIPANTGIVVVSSGNATPTVTYSGTTAIGQQLTIVSTTGITITLSGAAKTVAGAQFCVYQAANNSGSSWTVLYCAATV